MLANRLKQANVFCSVRCAALRIERYRTESPVFTQQRRYQYTPIILPYAFRNTNQIQLWRCVTHRASVCDNPPGYAFADSHSAELEYLCVFAGGMNCDSLTGLVINYKNDARIERYNSPKLVGDEGNCVVEIEG